MLRSSGRRRMFISVIVATAVLIGVGTIAWAAIPDANGTVHGCFKNSNGALRVIDPASDSCGASETAISLNQGVTGWEVKLAGTASNSDQWKSVVVSCSAGKKLLGGGARVLPSNVPEVALDTTAPAFQDQWVAGAHEVVPTDDSWSLTGFAICAYVTA